MGEHCVDEHGRLQWDAIYHARRGPDIWTNKLVMSSLRFLIIPNDLMILAHDLSLSIYLPAWATDRPTRALLITFDFFFV